MSFDALTPMITLLLVCCCSCLCTYLPLATLFRQLALFTLDTGHEGKDRERERERARISLWSV